MKKILSTLSILMLFFIFIQAEETVYDSPVLITSAGQSADVKLVSMLAKRSKIEHTVINMAFAKDLQGVKSLIIVPGFSSKGLGAAGVSQKDEMKRVKEIIKAAVKKDIPIILVHIGGKARRYGQSDDFINEVAKVAVHMIVVEQGNEDNIFTDISKDLKIPLDLVPKISKVSIPLKNLYTK